MPFPKIPLYRPAAGLIISPRIYFVGKSTPRGKFPFGFGRQPLMRPPAIRLGIEPGHLYDRIILLSGYVAPRPVRMPPVGALLPLPPLGIVVQLDRMIRRREDQGRRYQQRGIGLGRPRW